MIDVDGKDLLFILAQRDAGRVVAFAMGSRCPDPESVSEMGESLLDCHALSLARRAFIQYVSGFLVSLSFFSLDISMVN
jgi:hypothetical protein